MCAWASVSQFLPHNSAPLQLHILVSMQMDAEFKKEQNGTLFVPGGAVLGGGGVGGLFGPPAENFGMTSTTFFFYPPGCGIEKREFLAYFGACQAKIPVRGWCKLNISRARG